MKAKEREQSGGGGGGSGSGSGSGSDRIIHPIATTASLAALQSDSPVRPPSAGPLRADGEEKTAEASFPALDRRLRSRRRERSGGVSIVMSLMELSVRDTIVKVEEPITRDEFMQFWQERLRGAVRRPVHMLWQALRGTAVEAIGPKGNGCCHRDCSGCALSCRRCRCLRPGGCSGLPCGFPHSVGGGSQRQHAATSVCGVCGTVAVPFPTALPRRPCDAAHPGTIQFGARLPSGKLRTIANPPPVG